MVSEHLLDILPQTWGLGAGREGRRMSWGGTVPALCFSDPGRRKPQVIRSEPTGNKKGETEVELLCVAPLPSWRPEFQIKRGCYNTGAGHVNIPSQWQCLETREEPATSCSPHPDVWHGAGITHNASSQEVRGLEFRLERGRCAGRQPSL